MTPLRALAVLLVALATLGVLFAAESQASSLNRAGLVVAFPDRTEVHWVDFAEDQISGAELLRRSGLEVTFSGFGGLGDAVCAIEDVGCFDPGDCFCQCKSGACRYWAYFRWDETQGKWVTMPVGPSTRKLGDGDIDGWAWGSGKPPAWTAPPKEPCPTPDPPQPSGATPTPVPPAPEPPAAPSSGASSSPGGATTGASGSTGATAPPSPPPSPTDTGPPAATPQASPPPLTPTPSPDGGPAVLGRYEPPPADPDRPATASDAADGGGGIPAGLIAFGGVAGAMALAAGAVILRRRFGV